MEIKRKLILITGAGGFIGSHLAEKCLELGYKNRIFNRRWSKKIVDVSHKPLVAVGNKAIIEVIMDEYAKFGMKKFYIYISHKGKMIRAYFEEHGSDYTFQYITEDKPLGTAGAL